MPLPPSNSPAPDFTLPDQDGAQHTLSHHRGAWVLLYFYPKDDTAGCTKEACMIRDALPDFDKVAADAGAKMKVFGVSVDSVASHKKFAEKYGLPFTLLADEDKKVVNAYRVWGKKKFMGKEYDGILRTSFLIDPDGKIVKIYENVKPETHAKEVLTDLQALAG
jgi:peroxiredoxin Q/BCP